MQVAISPGEIVAAIVAIGVAAFGIVDAAKSLIGGINRIGFGHIAKAVTRLTPPSSLNPLSQKVILGIISAKWAAGVELGSQREAARELIKASLAPDNAPAFAQIIGIDPAALSSVATCLISGIGLSQAEAEVYKRFDLIVGTLIDQAFYRSTAAYRDGTRSLAAIVCVILGWIVAWIYFNDPLFGTNVMRALWDGTLLGFAAIPLAPIAKDVSTAVAAIVNKQARKFI